MDKKRLEPLVYCKQEIKEYLFEVLRKGEYLYEDEGIAFSCDYFNLLEKVKCELKSYFEKMNYKFTYVYDDSQKQVLLNKANENKYCFFRMNNKYLNSSTFTFEGVVKHETEYLAKGEIFSIMDIVEKFSNEVLNIPLLSGKDLYKEEYRWYVMLPNNEMQKVGQLSYDFEKTHNVKFTIDCSLFIAMLLVNCDDKGLVLTSKISPVDVVILPKNKAKPGTIELCEKVKKSLDGYNVLVDDSEETFGYKSSLYDLKGVPFKVIASMSEGNEKVVLCTRFNQEKEEIELEKLKRFIEVKRIKTNRLMLKNNRVNLDKNIVQLRNELVDSNMVNVIPWCGENCFEMDSNYDYLIPFHQLLSSVPCYYCGKLNKKFIYFFKKSQIF